MSIQYQEILRNFKRYMVLVAAKRRPIENDVTGWTEPDLVFVEVKCTSAACAGTSGLDAHAHDYRDIITARDGQSVGDIKLEFAQVVAQKMRLGLFDGLFDFKRFSPAVPELLVVFIDLDPNSPSMRLPLSKTREASDALGDAARIRFMRLNSQDYKMTADAALPLERLVIKNI